MRKSKRIISLLTALCLTLGLCPASAAEGRTVSRGYGAGADRTV